MRNADRQRNHSRNNPDAKLAGLWWKQPPISDGPKITVIAFHPGDRRRSRLRFNPKLASIENVMLQCITMNKASIRDLRYGFKKIERLLRQGEEIQITKRRRVIARLIPESNQAGSVMPDFLERLRTIYGDRTLKVSGAQLIAQDRSRY